MKELYTIYKGWRYLQDLKSGMKVYEVADRYMVNPRTVSRLSHEVCFVPPERVQRAVEAFTVK